MYVGLLVGALASLSQTVCAQIVGYAYVTKKRTGRYCSNFTSIYEYIITRIYNCDGLALLAMRHFPASSCFLPAYKHVYTRRANAQISRIYLISYDVVSVTVRADLSPSPPNSHARARRAPPWLHADDTTILKGRAVSPDHHDCDATGCRLFTAEKVRGCIHRSCCGKSTR